MGAALVSSPLSLRMQGVSIDYCSIHDPEMNLARLFSKTRGDPGSALTRWRHNRESSQPRQSGALA